MAPLSMLSTPWSNLVSLYDKMVMVMESYQVYEPEDPHHP